MICNIGIAQNAATTFWWVDPSETFTSWITSVADTPNPPTVISISWSVTEQYNSQSEMDTWNTEAMKLGYEIVSACTFYPRDF